jgi:hypothetical protein
MKYIDNESLQSLLENRQTPAVTIYAPMLISGSPPHITENQIRFKNLIHKAAEQLGKHDALAKELCNMREQLQHDQQFWEKQTPALLICATLGSIQMFHLPIDTEEYVAVDDCFHLAPVIALLNEQCEFYVLALAQQDPKLYKGTMFGLEPVAIDFPKNMREALGIDELNQKSENQGSAVSPSDNTGWFNGRGGARNPQEQDRLRYFRLISDLVCKRIDHQSSLVLAGVESDIAEFRSITNHPTILKGVIPGNQANAKLDDLFKAAYKIAWKEIIMPEHKAAIEEFTRLHGANPDRVAHDEQSVLKAAEEGRVDKLLASMSRDTSDTVQDSITSRLRITFPEPQQSSMLNRLASKVHRMSGRVINLLPEEMPTDSLMAARLRY